MAEKEYTRLPGRGIRRQSIVSVVRTMTTLWLGPDHLLVVDSMGGYTENYKRFFFRDIQAFQVRRTTRGRIWSAVLLFLSLVGGALAWTVSDVAWWYFWMAVGMFFGLLLLANVLQGPTCVTHIRTAVQVEEIPSLRRLRNVRRVLERLRPLIEQAQGTLDPSLVAGTDGVPGPAASPAIGAARDRASAATPYRGGPHLVLFSLLLVDALHTGLSFTFQHVALVVVAGFLWGGIGISLILALIRGQEAKLSAWLRNVTWGALGYGILAMGLSYAHQIALSIEASESGVAPDQWQILARYAELSPWDTPLLMATMLISLVGSTLLGVMGLAAAWRYRETVRKPPPLRSPAGTEGPV